MDQKFILFLDFDGVMHPQWDGLPHLSPLIEKFCYLQNIEKALDGLNFDIVISSSWRVSYPLDILQCFLGDILGPKIIGTTPDYSYPPHPVHAWMREAEILSWMNQNQRTEPWIAIDDWWLGFSPKSPNLYRTLPGEGFTEKHVSQFIDFVRIFFNKC